MYVGGSKAQNNCLLITNEFMGTSAPILYHVILNCNLMEFLNTKITCVHVMYLQEFKKAGCKVPLNFLDLEQTPREAGDDKLRRHA